MTKILGKVSLFESENTVNNDYLIAEKIAEFNYSIDGWVIVERSNYVKTSADDLGVEQRVAIVKQRPIKLWELYKKGKITFEQCLQAIQSKKSVNNFRKQLLDYKQRANLKEREQYKERADEDGNKFTENEFFVSDYPQPDERTQKKILKEQLKKCGLEIQMLLDYYEGNNKSKLTKKQVNILLKKVKKNIEHLI